MTQPLADKTIALAEGRQLEELAALLEREGALCRRCPMFSILDPLDDAPVLDWLDALCAGRFDWVVLLTGEGLRRILACAERHQRREQVVAAMAATKTLTRGPKPVRALKEVGLTPTRVAASPTTDGVIASLRELPLQGLTVGVQLYKESNPPLTDFLAEAGAVARTVLPYRYAPAADAEQVAQLIDDMQRGAVAAIVFTSAPQVDRLFEVALERGLEPALFAGLVRTRVAAVGPVVAHALEQRQVRVDVCPEQGWQMKNLVQHLCRNLGS
jgi:uroporphyrinogen-III synthase